MKKHPPLSEEQHALLTGLLDKQYWLLPQGVRVAIFKALGFSQREREDRIAKARALLLWLEIDQAKTRIMQETGKKRGSYNAAVNEVAAKYGMNTRENLEQFIRRHPAPANERRLIKELAARHGGFIVIKPGRRVVIQLEPTT